MKGIPSCWAMCGLLLLGLGGCAGDTLRGTRGYILISIDTLRADHLGCYGYPRPTSPFIDSLAERGALFENAYVQLPGTLPSHMSIFTGLYPAEHGVRAPAGVLSPDIETLPEVFQRQGFRTGGHTEGGYMHGGYGFARGFDDFSHEARKIESDVERTFARGLDFLKDLAETDRFFLFLHTYAVHDPYFPAEEHLRLFWPHPVPETFEATGPNFVAFNRGELEMSEEALRYYEAAYDASIHYVDGVLRDFFDRLSALGLESETTVVLTSDHGEEFREHGKMVHDQIYRESLHVPLIVIHPEIDAPRRIETIVESIDIAPTLHEIAGLNPKSPVSGRSLVRLLTGHEEPGAEAFAQGFAGRRRTLLRRQEGSLYQLLATGRSVELYDLAADPEASTDLSAERGPAVRKLLAAIGSYEERQPVASAETGELDPELEARLKSLGYLQ